MALKFFYTSPPQFASGLGFIAGEGAGLVSVSGVPARRPVLCFHKKTRRLAAATSSAQDGTYRFEGLSPSEVFYLVAFDTEGQFNAVIRDNITPAPMP